MPKIEIKDELNNKLNLSDIIKEFESFARMYRNWGGGLNPHLLTWLTGYLNALRDVGKIGAHDHIAMIRQLEAVTENPGQDKH